MFEQDLKGSFPWEGFKGEERMTWGEGGNHCKWGLQAGKHRCVSRVAESSLSRTQSIGKLSWWKPWTPRWGATFHIPLRLCVAQRTSSEESCVVLPWQMEEEHYLETTGLWYAGILFSSLGLGHRWWHPHQGDGFSSRDWHVGHSGKLQEALWKVSVLLHQGRESCPGPGESSEERMGFWPRYLDTSYPLLGRYHSL